MCSNLDLWELRKECKAHEGPMIHIWLPAFICMSYCPGCGTECEGNSNYCPNCGARLANNDCSPMMRASNEIITPARSTSILKLLVAIVLIMIIGNVILFS